MQRGQAMWWTYDTEDVDRQNRVLVVFLATDISGNPIIQEPGKMPNFTTWAALKPVVE